MYETIYCKFRIYYLLFKYEIFKFTFAFNLNKIKTLLNFLFIFRFLKKKLFIRKYNKKMYYYNVCCNFNVFKI